MLGKIPWNKGLTVETDERVAEYGRAISGSLKGKHHKGTFKKGHLQLNNGKGCFKKGHITWMKGKQHTEETKKKLSIAHLGKPPNSGSFTSERVRLENHWNWQGGRTFELYPLGWTKTYKEQIRLRDNYKCRLCGIPETECLTKLPIHHIDYNKSNLNPKNLLALCNSCHSKTNHNREYWEYYFNEYTINRE